MSDETFVNNKKNLLVTFQLADERWGINIFKVREIIPALNIIPCSDAPDFLAGLVQVRAQTIPVVNFVTRLGLVQDPESTSRIIILDLDEGDLGIMVDDVSISLIMGESKDTSVDKTSNKDNKRACVTQSVKYNNELIFVVSPELILSKKENTLLKEFKKLQNIKEKKSKKAQIIQLNCFAAS